MGGLNWTGLSSCYSASGPRCVAHSFSPSLSLFAPQHTHLHPTALLGVTEMSHIAPPPSLGATTRPPPLITPDRTRTGVGATSIAMIDPTTTVANTDSRLPPRTMPSPHSLFPPPNRAPPRPCIPRSTTTSTSTPSPTWSPKSSTGYTSSLTTPLQKDCGAS
ncbi:hypothetical protein B0H19DRAFT_450033 [Mycena capillaripes]|nr:hypothetical protein B0H19DRAFT_450033 [Mycena capillaripes]